MAQGVRHLRFWLAKACLQVRPDGRHRRAQLVGDGGDQLTARLQQPGDPVAFGGQLGRRPLKVLGHGVEVALKLGDLVLAPDRHPHGIVAGPQPARGLGQRFQPHRRPPGDEEGDD